MGGNLQDQSEEKMGGSEREIKPIVFIYHISYDHHGIQ